MSDAPDTPERPQQWHKACLRKARKEGPCENCGVSITPGTVYWQLYFHDAPLDRPIDPKDLHWTYERHCHACQMQDDRGLMDLPIEDLAYLAEIRDPDDRVAIDMELDYRRKLEGKKPIYW